MAIFDLTTLPYLARVTAAEVGDMHSQSPSVALYAPGLVCADTAAHRDAAATLYVGFLASVYECWGWLGRTCYAAWQPGADLAPWETALRNRQLLAGTGLSPTWRVTTQRHYWTLVPPLALLWQVEPHKGFLLGYLQRLTTDKSDLSAAQKKTVLAMLRERGAPHRSGQPWRAELAAHARVLQRRRDLTFRLGWLAVLDLEPADQETVQRLQAWNTQWASGLMQVLSAGQASVIAALEAQYLEQRLTVAQELAERLAAS